MVVTHKLRMDLEGQDPVQSIEVVQGDAYTRNILMRLYAGHQKWEIPEATTVLIRYRKPDGKCGEYDTLPDGSAAWSISGNELTIVLVPQALTAVGSVMLYASIILEQKIINTFAAEICVHSPMKNQHCCAAQRLEESKNYFYVTGILPVPDRAEIGQYIRVLDVDDYGKVTRVEAADVLDESQVKRIVDEYHLDNPPAPGADGLSPVAKVVQTENGATISITDKGGTTTAEITNGEDGVSVAHHWDGTVLSVTSVNGTSSADLKGDKGDPGVTTWDDIEKRPFGPGIGEVAVLDEVTVEPGTILENNISLNTNVRESETYKVILNGTEYTNVPCRYYDDTMRGYQWYVLDVDVGLSDPVEIYIEDHSEPAFMVTGGHTTMFTEVTVAIYGTGTVIVPVPMEYLDMEAIAKELPNQKASWNDLEDKPFGEVIAADGETVLEETEVTTSYEGMSQANMGTLSNESANLIAGDTYTVNFNGVDYLCKAVANEAGYVGIGNPALAGNGAFASGEDAEAPFCIADYQADSMWYVCTETEGTYTISIAVSGGIVTKLDEKYLPDSIARTADVETVGAQVEAVDARFSVKEMTAETIVEETEVETVYEGMSQANYGSISGDFSLIAGNTYIVNFEGVEYACIAVAGEDSYVGVGNPAVGVNAYGVAGDNPEAPFCISTSASFSSQTLYTETEGTYIVSIAEVTAGEKKLDSKYLDMDAIKDSLPTETWTFELEDGRTVSKQVMLYD